MIWLASFPRSGNTFVRNILFEVFGLESSTFDMHEGLLLEPGYLDFPVVKTHMLPGELIPDDPGIKAVYLVRDGRDALVSMAHHRSDIIAPGSPFRENLQAAIMAEKGSFFGGWSQNVKQWIGRADLIIRYEELIVNPAACIERIRLLAGWPEGDYSRIPTFAGLKFGLPRYGSGRDRSLSGEERKALAARNFRKGVAGAWQEEMPDDLMHLFWSMHGETMLKLGYHYGTPVPVSPDPDLDWEVLQKLGHAAPDAPIGRERIRVLVEADKLLSPVNDGVKRYEVALLKEFLHVHRNPMGRWHFSLLAGNRIQPIDAMEPLLEERFSGHSMASDQPAPLQLSLSARIQYLMLRMVPDAWKKWLTDHNIYLFHHLFDFGWRIVFFLTNQIRTGVKKLMRIVPRTHPFDYIPGGANGEHDPGTSGFNLAHLPLQHHYQPFVSSRLPKVVTLHDFTHRIYPEYHTRTNIRNAEAGWKYAVKNAAAIISVSESTAKDAQKFTHGGLRTDMDVVYHAIDRGRFHFRINGDDRRRVCGKYGIPEGVPFFLTLSSIEPRKNLPNILQAFFAVLAADTSMPLMLVVAGKQTWGSFTPHSLAGFNPQRVIFTGFVDDDDLPYLYSEALAYCYVSHYEGFGLPLLEAMNCGTPVIYGNNSSMPEVVGSAGLPADAGDFRSIATQMKRVYYDEALRLALRSQSLKQAARFSLHLMTRKTLDVYEKTLDTDSENPV
ncbi:MAG TPA: glycosyltransferase [Bacteroidales bacterium]|nr:glycosyltransferase [Bacteroidales bacterium]HRZ48266.1 glycosyltransferase [Bacteroidales bacterium]